MYTLTILGSLLIYGIQGASDTNQITAMEQVESSILEGSTTSVPISCLLSKKNWSKRLVIIYLPMVMLTSICDFCKPIPWHRWGCWLLHVVLAGWHMFFQYLYQDLNFISFLTFNLIDLDAEIFLFLLLSPLCFDLVCSTPQKVIFGFVFSVHISLP